MAQEAAACPAPICANPHHASDFDNPEHPLPSGSLAIYSGPSGTTYTGPRAQNNLPAAIKCIAEKYLSAQRRNGACPPGLNQRFAFYAFCSYFQVLEGPKSGRPDVLQTYA